MTIEQPAVPAVPAVPGGRVVVGIDGSEQSQRALRWAAFIAHAMHANVELVVAWSWGSATWAPYPSDWDPAADAQTIVEETLDKVFGSLDRPDHLVTLREGYAPEVLIAVSTGADMLVVGSRGHGGFAGMLLGSVSAICTEHATCPVLVIHGTTPAPPIIGRALEQTSSWKC